MADKDTIRSQAAALTDTVHQGPNVVSMPSSGPKPVPSAFIAKATPFVPGDPALVPRRQWLYPSTYVRKFVTGTVAPGGVGKTGLALIEGLSMVTGRDFLSDGYRGDKLRVWFWNGEDPRDEMARQIYAAMIHYSISAEDLGGRLFMDSGRDMPIRVVFNARNGFAVDEACVASITQTIRENQIDVALFDPLVSIHKASENANEAMDAVVKSLAQIANDTNCAIGVAAHTRKASPGMTTEVTGDDARGGKALVDGARVVRVLNRMTPEEGERAGIEGKAYRRYFRVGADKVNLTPPDEDTSWRYMESVLLPNGTPEEPGDSIRVVTPWEWPNPWDDVSARDLDTVKRRLVEPPRPNDYWRQDVQSPHWVGNLVADVLGLDMTDKAAKEKVKTFVKTWVKNGVLVVRSMQTPERKLRPCVFPGSSDQGEAE